MIESRPAAQALMACLGEESRFRLVQELIGGARCVTDLAAAVGLSQSCTTRHLQALERRRLVTGKRDGKRVLYRIREDDPGLLPLLGWALAEPGLREKAGRMTSGPALRGGAAARAAASAKPAGPRDSAEEHQPPAGVPEAAERAAEPGPRAPRGGSSIEDYLL